MHRRTEFSTVLSCVPWELFRPTGCLSSVCANLLRVTSIYASAATAVTLGRRHNKSWEYCYWQAGAVLAARGSLYGQMGMSTYKPSLNGIVFIYVLVWWQCQSFYQTISWLWRSVWTHHHALWEYSSSMTFHSTLCCRCWCLAASQPSSKLIWRHSNLLIDAFWRYILCLRYMGYAYNGLFASTVWWAAKELPINWFMRAVID